MQMKRQISGKVEEKQERMWGRRIHQPHQTVRLTTIGIVLPTPSQTTTTSPVRKVVEQSLPALDSLSSESPPGQHQTLTSINSLSSPKKIHGTRREIVTHFGKALWKKPPQKWCGFTVVTVWSPVWIQFMLSSPPCQPEYIAAHKH